MYVCMYACIRFSTDEGLMAETFEYISLYILVLFIHLYIYITLCICVKI